MALALGAGRKTFPGTGIQTWPRVEGPFPSLSTRGHLCSILQVGLQGPRHKGGEWKKAPECPQLRQPGLRHRAGQQHPCAMGLECVAGMGLSLASYPMAIVPARTLAKGVCNEHWVSTDLDSGLSLLEKSYITMGQACPASHPLMRPLDMTSYVMGGTLQNTGAPGPALGS